MVRACSKTILPSSVLEILGNERVVKSQGEWREADTSSYKKR